MGFNFNLHRAVKMSNLGRQVAVSQAAGIDSTKFSKIVNGWQEPSPEEMERIARVLDQPVEELFPGEK